MKTKNKFKKEKNQNKTKIQNIFNGVDKRCFEKIPMTKSWKIKKNAKTKEAVWDDLRTGIAPEKKLWTVETEIYRLVMSNGESGDWNWVKSKLGFRFLDSNFGCKFLRGEFLMFWLGFSLLKHVFGLQKIFFVQILIKMTPFFIFCQNIFLKLRLMNQTNNLSWKF